MSTSVRNRPVDFSSNDVQVRCVPCGATFTLAQEQHDNYEYVATCPHCSRRLAPDDRQLALTDPDDPMQDAAALPTVAWFHASTYEQWPPPVAAKRDRALHLGTYEAAIDAMHYRMENQNEANDQFYLHRVTLSAAAAVDSTIHPDGGPPGWGILRLTELTDHGYDIRRYINDREYRGSLSLATTLEAVTSVQTIAIPVIALSPAATSAALAAEAAYAAELSSAEHEHAVEIARLEASPEEPDPNPLRQKILDMTGQSAVGRANSRRDRRGYQARGEFEATLARAYLSTGISDERITTLTDAVRRMSLTADPTEHHEAYRSHAALLTASEEVVRRATSAAPYRAQVLDAPR